MIQTVPATSAPAYVPIGARARAGIVPRPAVSSDLAYVLSTWEASWRLSARCKRLSGRDYRSLFTRMVREGLMREDDTRVTIGCDETSPSRIWSWVCWTPGRTPVIHYAYTRAKVDGIELRNASHGAGMFRVLVAAIGIRDALVHTMEPVAQASKHDRRNPRLKEALLAAAEAGGIATVYRPVEEWLDLRSGS